MKPFEETIEEGKNKLGWYINRPVWGNIEDASIGYEKIGNDWEYELKKAWLSEKFIQSIKEWEKISEVGKEELNYNVAYSDSEYVRINIYKKDKNGYSSSGRKTVFIKLETNEVFEENLQAMKGVARIKWYIKDKLSDVF